jgi:hypothetical protein
VPATSTLSAQQRHSGCSIPIACCRQVQAYLHSIHAHYTHTHYTHTVYIHSIPTHYIHTSYTMVEDVVYSKHTHTIHSMCSIPIACCRQVMAYRRFVGAAAAAACTVLPAGPHICVYLATPHNCHMTAGLVINTSVYSMQERHTLYTKKKHPIH